MFPRHDFGKRPMKAALAYCFLVLYIGCAQASDLAREQRIRDQIEDETLLGEATTLQTGNVAFFAIRMEAQTPARRGGVILAHERAAHPDWRQVIHPLRTRLAEHGWETLSLQMPLAAQDAPLGAYKKLFAEAAPRFAFAAEMLAQRDIEYLVVIGHGLGADMLAQWLTSNPPEQVRAFIAIGLPVNAQRPLEGALAALKKIQLPVLDIYGSRDLKPVLRTARLRAAAARSAQNTAYTQVEIEGADHFFHDLDETLTARVRAWMAKTLADDPGGAGRNPPEPD